MPSLPMPTYPRFDHDRGDEEDGMARHVLDADQITVAADITGDWLTVPIRTVFVDVMGPRFEFGPFSVSGSDATKLVNALARYGEMTGEFKPRQGVADA